MGRLTGKEGSNERLERKIGKSVFGAGKTIFGKGNFFFLGQQR